MNERMNTFIWKYDINIIICVTIFNKRRKEYFESYIVCNMVFTESKLIAIYQLLISCCSIIYNDTNFSNILNKNGRTDIGLLPIDLTWT